MPFQAWSWRLFEYPVWLDELLKRLGATLVPVALVSVGYQIQFSHVRGRAAALSVGLAFKLVIGPALMLAIFAAPLASNGSTLNVTVFEAAMGPMIGASIVAMDHDVDPPLVTLMVGLGTLLSFLTLPLWWYVLSLL